MSRRIPGREPSFSGSVQLRAWRSPVVSTPVLPPPDGSGPVDEPLDRQWTEYLAAPTREARDRLVVRYTPLVRVVAHRVLVGLPTHVDHADLTSLALKYRLDLQTGRGDGGDRDDRDQRHEQRVFQKILAIFVAPKQVEHPGGEVQHSASFKFAPRWRRDARLFATPVPPTRKVLAEITGSHSVANEIGPRGTAELGAGTAHRGGCSQAPPQRFS